MPVQLRSKQIRHIVRGSGDFPSTGGASRVGDVRSQWNRPIAISILGRGQYNLISSAGGSGQVVQYCSVFQRNLAKTGLL